MEVAIATTKTVSDIEQFYTELLYDRAKMKKIRRIV
jgi:hypothetical protein